MAAPVTPTNPDELAAALAEKRLRSDVERADELDRARAEAAHERDRADLAADVRQQARDRAEREAEGRAAAKLAAMRREALAAGERLRIKTALAGSGEARAWRLERLHVWNLRVLGPALILFGALSTSGVQTGAAALFDWTRDDVGWWALWGLEPGLIAAICWIIHVRGQLALSGGRLATSVEVVMGAALATSVGFNVAGGGSGQGIREMAGHSMAPLLAAGTAWLIGAIDRSIADTNPWKAARPGERVRSILDPVTDDPAPAESTTPVAYRAEVAPVSDPVDGADEPGDVTGDAPGETNPGDPPETHPLTAEVHPVEEDTPLPGVPDAPGEIAAPAAGDPVDPPAVDVAALGSGAAQVRAAMEALGDRAQPKPVGDWLAARGVTLKTETIRSALKQERKRRAAAAERGGVVPLQRRARQT